MCIAAKWYIFFNTKHNWYVNKKEWDMSMYRFHLCGPLLTRLGCPVIERCWYWLAVWPKISWSLKIRTLCPFKSIRIWLPIDTVSFPKDNTLWHCCWNVNNCNLQGLGIVWWCQFMWDILYCSVDVVTESVTCWHLKYEQGHFPVTFISKLPWIIGGSRGYMSGTIHGKVVRFVP
jgi:hypothetical protein